MNFFDGIRFLKKDSYMRKEIDQIIGNLPDSDVLAQSILKKLKNNKTKYVFDKDIKGNYYVHLNDTIYLSNRQSEKSNYERLCIIAHECIHSIQPKWLQNINFIFSNLEMVFFVLFIILYFFKVSNVYTFLSYLIVAVLAIIPRLILEMWAMLKAPKISKEYLEEENLNKEEIEKVENVYNFVTKLLIPVGIIQMFFFKLLRIALVSILSFCKF